VTFSAKVKGDFVYVVKEGLRSRLIKHGFKPLHKLNSSQDVWVFAKTEEILGHLMFNKEDKENFVTSDRMMF